MEFFSLDYVSRDTGDTFSIVNFDLFPRFFSSEIVTDMMNWQQDFVSSNSVFNHTHDEQIGLPLSGRPILLITHTITDRSGLHAVLLPLRIIFWFRLYPYHFSISLVSRMSTKTPFFSDGIGDVSTTPST